VEVKIARWIRENLDRSLLILVKVNMGLGLSDAQTRELKLTSLFAKFHKNGYITGTYYAGHKVVRDGSRLTEKGKTILKLLEKKIEKSITPSLS